MTFNILDEVPGVIFGVPRRDAARAWVEKLLDPDAVQVASHLKTPEGYCCLGILTEKVCNIPLVKTFDTKETGLDPVFGWKYPGSESSWQTSVLPYPAIDAFWEVKPLDNPEDPILKIPDELQHRTRYDIPKDEEEDFTVGVSQNATNLNDVYAFTFQEIAQCVKHTWPELFEESA